MLKENEIKLIEALIDEDKSNYQIRKEKGYAIGTIDTIRKKKKEREQSKIAEEETSEKNLTDIIRKFIKEIDILLESKHLTEKEEKTWEKRKEQLRELLKAEVDDRIHNERADAEQKRDQLWLKNIEENYVDKTVVTQSKKTVQEQEKTIISLRTDNIKKDIDHEKDQKKIMELLEKQQDLENRLQNLFKQNLIRDCEVNFSQVHNTHEQNKLAREKTDFDTYKETQGANLDAMFQEVEQKRKDVETREKLATEREEKLQKQENELEASKNRWNKLLSETLTTIKNHVEDIAYDHCETMVKKCFEKQLNEINQQKKEINDQKV